MATMTPTNALVATFLSSSLIAYAGYHCYAFDKGRCLIPSRSNWVRPLVIYFQFMTAFCFFIWTSAFAIIKYQLGYIALPGVGYHPVPYVIWPDKWRRVLQPVYVMLYLAFVTYDCVNIEEWLYWIYLLRTVRTGASSSSKIDASNGNINRYKRGSSTSKPIRWVLSHMIVIWVLLSAAVAIIQAAGLFAGKPSIDWQTIRFLIVMGSLGMVTAFASLGLALMFPSFIKLVRDAGASSDVVGRLTLFHEINKIRIVVRFFFALCCLTLGIDGTTDKKRIVLTPFASDLLFTGLIIGFYVSCILSWMAYLPVQWGRVKINHTNTSFSRKRQPRRMPVRHQHSVPGAPYVNAPSAAASNKKLYDISKVYPGNNTLSNRYLSASQSVSDSYGREIFRANRHQHKTLVNLLRERGHIGETESVPEEALLRELEDEEENHEALRLSRISGDTQLHQLGGGDPVMSPSQNKHRHASREPLEDQSYLDETRISPSRREAGPGEMVLHEALQNFEGPANPFGKRYSTSIKDVVIEVTQEVQVQVDDGPSTKEQSGEAPSNGRLNGKTTR